MQTHANGLIVPLSFNSSDRGAEGGSVSKGGLYATLLKLASQQMRLLGATATVTLSMFAAGALDRRKLVCLYICRIGNLHQPIVAIVLHVHWISPFLVAVPDGVKPT